MTFDAAEIADRATAEGGDPLSEVVGQLAGYASVCWENMAGTGEFQSEDARDAVESTLRWIRGHTVVTLEPGQRLVLVVDQERLDSATAEQLSRAVTSLGAQPVLVISSDLLKSAHVVPVAGGVGVRDVETEPGKCPAVLNIAGEHYPCQQMEQMVEGSVGHDGWAHSNRDAEAIWEG